MQMEIDTLVINEMWDFVPLPLVVVSIICKWVFQVKFLSFGALDKCKLILVARSFLQAFGIGFQETFIHVVKSTIIRVVLAIVVSKGWTLERLMSTMLSMEIF